MNIDLFINFYAKLAFSSKALCIIDILHTRKYMVYKFYLSKKFYFDIRAEYHVLSKTLDNNRIPKTTF